MFSSLVLKTCNDCIVLETDCRFVGVLFVSSFTTHLYHILQLNRKSLATLDNSSTSRNEIKSTQISGFSRYYIHCARFPPYIYKLFGGVFRDDKFIL